jgi:hypothetical protein
MRAVLDLHGNKTFRLSDVVLDANCKADHALYLAGCSRSHFDRVEVGGALYDGVHLAKHQDGGAHAINDANAFAGLTAGGNGVFFRTPGVGTEHLFAQQISTLTGASASVAAGSNIVSFDGVDLTELGIRAGDPLRVVTGGREFFLIQGVLSESTLRVSLAPDVSVSGCDFAIGRGCGYYEEDGSGDNNTNQFLGGLFRCNAGYGLALGGGYGPSVVATQFDFGRFWAIRVGCDSTEIGITISMSPAFWRPYFETFEAKPFLVRACTGMGVYHPNAPADLFDIPHPENARGVCVDDEGIRPIGFSRSYVPATKTLDARLEGHTELGGAAIQPVPTGAPLDASGVHWILRPGLEPITLSGTPTLAIRGSKPLWLQNDGPGSITLQDESVLAGSKLKLRSPTLTLEEKQIVHLLCDGVHWIHVG